jgi:hypothetical protein|tara:strand:+ start:1100 stop:1423 length:324 start_codon:yes stop_codon:yes gene_type:complete
MIQNKKHEEGDIVAIKLVTAEEVIAKVVEEGADSIKVMKPMMLVHTPKGLAMSQFLMMQDVKDAVEISTSNIIAITKANSVASSQYSQTVTSIKAPTPEEKSKIISA